MALGQYGLVPYVKRFVLAKPADPKFIVRLPEELKAFIADQAALNSSSQNSEIVRCIRERMEKRGAAEAATSPRQIHANPFKRESNEYAQ